jgi:hypothetical protein
MPKNRHHYPFSIKLDKRRGLIVKTYITGSVIVHAASRGQALALSPAVVPHEVTFVPTGKP